MAYIYLVSNNVNDKVYVGQTRRPLKKRWYDHVFNSTHEERVSLIDRAIKKYGKENFKISVIEEVKSEKLNERERYWISYYNSNKIGYNITIGGEGTVFVSDSEILEAWKKGGSISESAKRVGMKRSAFSNRIHALGISDEEIKARRYESTSKSESTPIYQYDIDGHFVAEYMSRKEAKLMLGITYGFDRAIAPPYHLLKGYQWRKYKTDKIDSFKPWKHPNIKEVCQYDLDGNYIRSYSSISEASKETNTPNGMISCVAQGKRKMANGFIWKYKSESAITVANELASLA